MWTVLGVGGNVQGSNRRTLFPISWPHAKNATCVNCVVRKDAVKPHRSNLTSLVMSSGLTGRVSSRYGLILELYILAALEALMTSLLHAMLTSDRVGPEHLVEAIFPLGERRDTQGSLWWMMAGSMDDWRWGNWTFSVPRISEVET